MYRMFHLKLAERAPSSLCDGGELRKNLCLKSYKNCPNRVGDKVTRHELYDSMQCAFITTFEVYARCKEVCDDMISN